MKKKIFAFLTAALILCGCNSETEESLPESSLSEKSTGIFAMDTYMQLKIYGDNTDSAMQKSTDEILRLEKIFDVTSTESDTSKINSAGGSAAEVEDDTIQVINKACEISQQTDGALDLTVYPVLKEWGFTTQNYKIPTDEEISALLKYVDYTKIERDDKSVKIPKDMQIDFGSVAKGYTGDRVSEILKSEGITSAIINLGGNVQTIGTKPDGSLWKVGIENPIDTEKTVCKLSVSDCAVITSGNYERFFVGEDGNKYWHIIDPKTGYPADNGIISATIIGKSGITCDALSTALFVMGTDKAIEYCKEHKDIEAILITDEMKLYITEGISENAEIELDDYTVIKRN